MSGHRYTFPIRKGHLPRHTAARLGSNKGLQARVSTLSQSRSVSMNRCLQKDQAVIVIRLCGRGERSKSLDADVRSRLNCIPPLFALEMSSIAGIEICVMARKPSMGIVRANGFNSATAPRETSSIMRTCTRHGATPSSVFPSRRRKRRSKTWQHRGTTPGMTCDTSNTSSSSGSRDLEI